MKTIRVTDAATQDKKTANTMARELVAASVATMADTLGDKATNADILTVLADACIQGLLHLEPEKIAVYLHYMVDLRRDQKLGRQVDAIAAHERAKKLFEAAWNTAALRVTPPEGRA